MRNELYIVDDHKMLLRGLKDYLEEHTNWKCPYIFTNKTECLEKLKEIGPKSLALPEIIIVDIQLADETGYSLVQEITKHYKTIKCVMYSMYDSAGYILQAKNSGAKGYVSKVASEEELVHCLEVVQSGGIYLEKEKIEAQQKLEDLTLLFTKQETCILEKLLQGKSNEDISNELFISMHTVENYVSFIYDKTNVKNRAELLEKFK
jgi:DNA-binding NarL/FixJ family response regulator